MHSAQRYGGCKIAVCLDSEENLSLVNLAQTLRLPLIDEPDEAFAYSLRYRRERLELHKFDSAQHGPVYVDFLTGRLGYRLARDLNKHQPLARALGLKRRPRPSVIDATAGLGRDASILAALGCRVLMLERSPIIAALLEDGLRRAGKDAFLGPMIKERVDLKSADAVDLLSSLPETQRPEIIYLDPMYPQRKKNAKVKKEMRVLRDIVGEDKDAATLVHMALKRASRRVVVKRSRHAKSLPGPAPCSAIHGKTTRYDIYPITSARER